MRKLLKLCYTYSILINGILINGILINGILINGILINGILINGILIIGTMNMEKHSGEKPAALLINPPVYDFALFDLFLRPYGLLRVASWLACGGYGISMVDCLSAPDVLSDARLGKPVRRKNGTGKFHKQPAELPSGVVSPGRRYFRYGICAESIMDKLKRQKPELILVASGMTYWYEGIREIISMCREVHPGVPVVCGGVYASLMPDHCLKVCRPDFTVKGSALPALAGILSGLGLPVPENSAIPENPYVFPESGDNAGILRLHEGCPCRCDYCASHLLCPGFVPGDGINLYSRFRTLYDCGVRHFAFYDDALLFEKEKGLYPFLDELIRNNDQAFFYLPNAVHAREIDRECASLLFRAGFREIRIGYESDEDSFHSEHGSPKTGLSVFTDAVANLKHVGFDGRSVVAYTLAGLPGQTAGEAEKAAAYACSQGIRVSVSEYSPIPGTVLWNKALHLSRYPLAAEPVYHSNSYFSCEWEQFTRADMQAVKRKVFEANRDLLFSG